MTIHLTLKLTVPKTCDSMPFSSCNKENVPVPSCKKRNVECGGTPQQFLSQTDRVWILLKLQLYFQLFPLWLYSQLMHLKKLWAIFLLRVYYFYMYMHLLSKWIKCLFITCGFFLFSCCTVISYGITESTRTMCRGFPIYPQVALTEVRCKHHRLMTETSPNKNFSSGIDTISSMTFPISFSLSFGVLWFMQCTFMAEKW